MTLRDSCSTTCRRSMQTSRERDMEKTEQIIGALKRNGFHLNNPTYGYTFYRENKGIIAYDNSYVYPQGILLII